MKTDKENLKHMIQEIKEHLSLIDLKNDKIENNLYHAKCACENMKALNSVLDDFFENLKI